MLPGEAGDGDEGTAMLEIIHDLAPNAELGFATAFTSDASFADNIRALRFEAGCDVIVDDVIYFNEHPFQDGPIAQSVNAVTADGALFFSSAGNEGNIDRRHRRATTRATSPTRAGRSASSPARRTTSTPAPGVQVFEPISPTSSADVPVTLFWADPLGGAANDYDLYLFDADDNVVAVLAGRAERRRRPVRDPRHPAFGGSGAAARRREVLAARTATSSSPRCAAASRTPPTGSSPCATPGVTRGHSATRGRVQHRRRAGRRALPFELEPGDPPNPTGPFPGAFTTTQQPERFTSDGPRRVFFRADGTPITPGNFSSTGGACGRSRTSPRPTACARRSTSFDPFFGTSAAAPHAAAIAALVLSGNPGAGMAEVREAFEAPRSTCAGRRRRAHRARDRARRPGAVVHRRHAAAARAAGHARDRADAR